MEIFFFVSGTMQELAVWSRAAIVLVVMTEGKISPRWKFLSLLHGWMSITAALASSTHIPHVVATDVFIVLAAVYCPTSAAIHCDGVFTPGITFVRHCEQRIILDYHQYVHAQQKIYTKLKKKGGQAEVRKFLLRSATAISPIKIPKQIFSLLGELNVNN